MRLIDADALLKASRIGKVLYFNDTATDGYTDVLLAVEVERAPTIEAEPVKHGRWIDNRTSVICSHCNAEYSDEIFLMGDNVNYCPGCGAKNEKIKF